MPPESDLVNDSRALYNRIGSILVCDGRAAATETVAVLEDACTRLLELESEFSRMRARIVCPPTPDDVAMVAQYERRNQQLAGEMVELRELLAQLRAVHGRALEREAGRLTRRVPAGRPTTQREVSQ